MFETELQTLTKVVVVPTHSSEILMEAQAKLDKAVAELRMAEQVTPHPETRNSKPETPTPKPQTPNPSPELQTYTPKP